MSALLLGLALSVGAPALKEKAAPEPTLVGEWAPESVTVGGKPSEPGGDRWLFRADGTWAMCREGRELSAGLFSSDPKASPGAVNLADKAAQRANLGRYRVDGDTLVISLGHVPGVRPADLELAEKVTVWVFKRVKPEK